MLFSFSFCIPCLAQLHPELLSFSISLKICYDLNQWLHPQHGPVTFLWISLVMTVSYMMSLYSGSKFVHMAAADFHVQWIFLLHAQTLFPGGMECICCSYCEAVHLLDLIDCRSSYYCSRQYFSIYICWNVSHSGIQLAVTRLIFWLSVTNSYRHTTANVANSMLFI